MAAPTPNRPTVVGDPSGPEAPYPLKMSGLVINGFRRGSKELGIPTANLPVDDGKTPWISSIPSGVYFGWASLRLPPSHPDYVPTPPSAAVWAIIGLGIGILPLPLPGSAPSEETKAAAAAAAAGGARGRGRNGFTVYPMVMSIGYNPFYKNAGRSVEVHVLHGFGADFYGAEMRLLVAGFIRDERDYPDLDALVADIRFDCAVAKRSLARDAWAPRGLDVELDLPADGDGVGGPRVVRGTLDCDWLIRPSELPEGKGE
ncbi:hypothetical protein VTH06DRAFT_7795 [Thermothelomyces fergusii]